MIIPGRLGGDSPLVRWLNQIRDAVDAFRQQMNQGRAPEIIAGKFERLHRLKDVFDDYIIVRTWDGTNESSGDIAVAKPKVLRTSAEWSESKYGVTHTYTFPGGGPDETHNKLRNDDWGTGDEDQLVTRPWVIDEEIEIMPGQTTAVDGDGNPIWLRYVGPARQWAEIEA